MTRAFFVVVALLALACGTAAAQTPDVPIWYPQQNTARLHVESWQEGAWLPIVGGAVALHGWAWHCGGIPIAWHVYRADPTTLTTVEVPGVTVETVYRPDVLAAFADLPCSMGDYQGVVLRVPLPVGTHQLLVQAYVSGGLWHPTTGQWLPASAVKRVHVVAAMWEE